jgi:AcrR family transcriptional regulator
MFIPELSVVRDVPDKREAILEAALDLFAEKGFHGTSVPEVAQRAGVGAGTIYRHFESKEALVNALYQQWKAAMASALLEDFPFDAPPRRQFHLFWRRWAGFVREHPRAAMFLELHHHAPYLDATSRGIEEQAMQLFRMFLGRAADAGIVRSLPVDLLVAVVRGVFVGMARGWLDGRFELDEATLEAAETCCWEAIRA